MHYGKVNSYSLNLKDAIMMMDNKMKVEIMLWIKNIWPLVVPSICSALPCPFFKVVTRSQ